MLKLCLAANIYTWLLMSELGSHRQHQHGLQGERLQR